MLQLRCRRLPALDLEQILDGPINLQGVDWHMYSPAKFLHRGPCQGIQPVQLAEVSSFHRAFQDLRAKLAQLLGAVQP